MSVQTQFLGNEGTFSISNCLNAAFDDPTFETNVFGIHTG